MRHWCAPVVFVMALSFACADDAEEVVDSESTSSASATAGDQPSNTPGGSSPTDTATAVPTAAATPNPDWATYSDPDSRFTLRYPDSWFEFDGELSSVDLSNSEDHETPREAIFVEISVSADDGYGCGVETYDIATGEVVPEEGAVRASLGGVQGWSITRDPGDPLLNDPYTRIEAVSAVHEGFCFHIAGYLTQAIPDTETFTSIVATFRLGDGSATE